MSNINLISKCSAEVCKKTGVRWSTIYHPEDVMNALVETKNLGSNFVLKTIYDSHFKYYVVFEVVGESFEMRRVFSLFRDSSNYF